MDYKIELEADRATTKVYVWEGSELVGLKVMNTLTPTKNEVGKAVNEIICTNVKDIGAIDYLKKLEIEINAELTSHD